jgi:hypothetical protein
MSNRQVLAAFTLATALAIPNASRAEPPADGAPCFLEDSRVFSVKPFYGKSSRGDAELRPLRGAEVPVWIPRLEGIQDRPAAGGRVADMGCGHGASTLLLARACPRAESFCFDSPSGFHRGGETAFNIVVEARN